MEEDRARRETEVREELYVKLAREEEEKRLRDPEVLLFCFYYGF